MVPDSKNGVDRNMSHPAMPWSVGMSVRSRSNWNEIGCGMGL